MQAIATVLGGKVTSNHKPEFGNTPVHIEDFTDLFVNVPQDTEFWMSHSDSVTEVPHGFVRTSSASFKHQTLPIYGVQFHPEVSHSSYGSFVIKNFIHSICKCNPNWQASSFIENSIQSIRSTVNEGESVLLAVSGGVDSTVLAVLLHKAVNDRLVCVFVDHGLHPEGEPEFIVRFLQDLEIKVHHIKCRDRFVSKLKGVTNPESKRKIIGAEFIEVFNEAAKGTNCRWLAQGTIYSDVIESNHIKSHHNVGGLPKVLNFELLEPLRPLFKDEVREVGIKLGLPFNVVWKQPVPGPGLALRIVGEVTKEKLKIVRKADCILRKHLKHHGLDDNLWQWFAALLDVKTTGVKGDARSYEYPIVLRIVQSADAMTANVPSIPHDVLLDITNEICNTCDGVNRVFLDLTSKPSATIEYQ